MKQVANRQKLLVKPREDVQKFLSKQRDVRKPVKPPRRGLWRGSSGPKVG